MHPLNSALPGPYVPVRVTRVLWSHIGKLMHRLAAEHSRNPMPNIIFTGDLNFPTIDWQIETADSGTHENQVQANAFLQFAQEQCLQQYIEEPTRKNNILDVFLTNNDQLIRQIIITEHK